MTEPDYVAAYNEVMKSFASWSATIGLGIIALSVINPFFDKDAEFYPQGIPVGLLFLACALIFLARLAKARGA